MKPAQKAKLRLVEMEQSCQRVHDAWITHLPRLDAQLAHSMEALIEFHTSFETQLNTIIQTERLSNLRADRLEASLQEVQFWNHLKEGIIDRQKQQNQEICRVAENVSQASDTTVESERAVQGELAKARQQEESRKGRFKNVPNRVGQQGDTIFQTEDLSLRMALERNKELYLLELKFHPEKHKYIVVGECHPKVAALVSHFNFHKDLPRLRKEVSEMLAVL